ncbi:hypothetical protein SUGI_0630120 [Cryptomeria japonica]|uniref:uncharacterized protein LOC131058427 n=1 Tax=Cryptomeria japonica TaxID=3369 RepID=UPI002414C655|nr:uncharacterized protein LOC131058427 [Cryptomeria japonica]GLJ31405.1 hypothetical protein SUGI_0630120 [Cryptomeria japonica]
MLLRSSSSSVLDSLFGGHVESEAKNSSIRRCRTVQVSPGRHQMHVTDDGNVGQGIRVESKFKRVVSETDLSQSKSVSPTPSRRWSMRTRSGSFGSSVAEGEASLDDVLWYTRLDESPEEEEFEDSETQFSIGYRSSEHPFEYSAPGAKSMAAHIDGVSGKTESLLGLDGLDSGATAGVASLVRNRPVESEVNSGYYNGGFGSGDGSGLSGRGGNGGRRGGSGPDSNSTDDYYQKMLQANPGNPLLLSNYAKYLHEVQHDLKKAEEYYGRAILASPADGDALSLYAKLIWDVHKDAPRAESYYDRAVEAAPDDCYVLGSYAHFLWNAEEEEEDEDVTLQTDRVPITTYGAAAPAS